MKQQTLAVAGGIERFGRQTRRAEFLSQMELVEPWAELVALIEPHYPKAGAGRPPVGLERMLRIYFLQQWFNLSDPAVEDALYDSLTMRRHRPWPRARAGRDDRLQVPPPAGAARAGQADTDAGEPRSGAARVEDRHRHDRRCDHPGRAVVDQE